MTAVESELAPEVPALEVQGLEVVYQRVVEALRGVSLTVPPGAIVALLGPNGAGKTTLLRAVSGLLAVHSGQVRKGRVRLGSLDVTSESSARIVRAGMAQALEGRQLFPALTVEENLRTGAYTRRRSRAGVAESLDQVYALFPKLAERREQAAGYLSGGEQQMVAIGRALMARPRLLVLDEPSLGLAPRVVEEIRTVIVEINQTGTAVLLVEQNAMLALSIADHGYLMEGGRVVLNGSAAALRANPDIQEFYLGLGGSRAGGVDYRQVKRYRRRKGWG